MKRKLTFLLTAFLLLTLGVLPLSMTGQTRDDYSYTFTAKVFDSNNQTKTLNEVDWTFAGTGGEYYGYDATKGQQFGSGSKPFTAFTLSTSDISGTITEIKVNTSGANSIAGTLNVSVGGNAFGDSYTLTNTATEVTFSGSASGEIAFNYAQTSSKAIYIKSISVTYSSGGGQQETVATPTFTPAEGTYFEAQSVSIECATEGASIYYTLDGSTPDENSTLYANPISISETTTVKAIGVKEGYTNSSVATATYTFPSIVNISDITAAGTYTVQGTIVAKSTRGFIVGDGSGYVYYYNQNYSQSTYNIGDMVRLSGNVVVYGGVFEFNNTATITTATSSNYVAEEPTVITGAEMDSRVASTTPAQLSNYVQYVGTLTVSGTYYNITNIEGATTAKGSISFPINTDFTELNGQEVVVKGYYVGVSSSQYYNTMIGSVEVNVVPDPVLTVSVTELTDFRYMFGSGPSASKNFTIAGTDLTNGVTLTAPENYELSLSPDNGYFDSDEMSPVNGTIEETTIYVRLKAGLGVGPYSGNITIVCGDITHTIALSGNVDALPVAASPTFSPVAGTYMTEQNVAISCETEGATIYYTIDGTDPTEESTVYSAPITVSETTTIKAMAVASGYDNSAIAEATYTINEVITIAEARALANNAYACVEGTVIFIDGRNVYVQDETAGIDLFLNNNTVPSGLAIGDNVRAYGKHAVYNGLVELSGINGGNANNFVILSSGNDLPLATYTIAEILEDYNGDNMLQSTRVKIEDAIIGAINTSGNTVITQDGNNLNVYRIPTVEGMIEGDLVTMTGIIGCYNAPQLRVVSADDVEFTHRPVLTANPSSITGLTYEYEQGGPSDIVYFELSGDYLIGNVAIYPSESFEVSTQPTELFQPENPARVFIPASGHFYDIKIYVRMKAGLDGGTYTEQLAVATEGADTLFVNVTGTVTGGPEPPTPSGDYVRISDLSQLAEGSLVVFAARFDENAGDYYAMSNTSSGKPTGVLFTSATAGENEILPASIADEETSYYWTVGVTANGYTFTNAAGELIGYSSSTNFSTGGDNTEWEITNETSGEGTMVPNYTGYVITNVNNNGRAFALNNSHNFGPYSKSNMAGAQAGNYNFYLDLFVKTEGSGTLVVATPTFTPAAGTYYEAQEVTISCATEGATIYYSTESENGPWTEYESAITVDETTTLWAYAVKEGYDDSNVAEATYTIQMGFVTIFNQDWEGEMNGWTFVDVVGPASWNIATYSNNHYAYANGYNQGANEDWCISPAFNLDAYDNPTLTFRTAKNYNGNDLEVFFSNNYNGTNPASATWTALTCALSTGSYTWVESGAIDLSSFSGTNCYIGFKYTCEEGSAAAWEVDDIMLIGQTSEPVVTVTPTTLTGFTYIEGNGPSAEQSFTVAGLNLSDDITVAEATDYEISLASGDDFTAQSTLTLTPVGGNVEETTIYVRLKAGLAVGDYNDEAITVTCDDVDDIEVTCSGNVTEQPVPGDDYVRIADVSELMAGNRVILASRYNSTSNAYLAVANTLTSGKLGTTEFTSAMNGSDEIIPASILAAEDDYYWTVDVNRDGYTFTNANGQVLSYNSGTNFNFTGNKTEWTITTGVADTASLVPEYNGFSILNVDTPTRGMALRVTDANSVVGAYSTSNMTNSEYNFFLDIFMQGEGGTPTVAAPTFDPAAGTYYEAQDVTISCATPEATVYYSLSSETGPWEEYEEAITVDESMTIWAYATKEGYNDSPVVSAEYVIQNDLVIIFNQDWEEDWHGWTERCVAGDSLWRIASYQGNHYAYANGYNHPATEDWLISPAFNLDSYSDVVLTFLTAQNYTGPELEVYFSNDYDGQNPTNATWEQLECTLSQGGWNWTESGDISLDEFNGTNCYIGFRYQCTDTEAAGWEVDDIMLVSGTNTNPTLTATPNTINGLDYIEGEGPSASQSYTLTGANLVGEGDITVSVTENFEISLDDEEYVNTLSLPFADGVITDQPVTIYVRLVEDLEIGSYSGTITHEGGGAYTEVILNGTVHSENEPSIAWGDLPHYIQGNNGSNNNRVPVATYVRLQNLEPYTTYRYTNQFVDENDGPETAGAGNVIYANLDGFYRTTSPSLATEGGYGEFTTNWDGEADVWFVNEPTANARFTPGNHVYLRIRLNDGHDGTTVTHTFTTESYATVINFGTEHDANQGSAFYVKSNENPMTFAQMFTGYLDPQNPDTRPIFATIVETTGVDFGNINQYADFYKEEVAGKDGWFGGILPNDNEYGINKILVFDITHYWFQDYYTAEFNGQWAPEAYTVNPSAGLDEPIFIDLTDDGVEEDMATNVKIWSADHEFVIENGDNANYTMTVYNVLGQPMMHHQVNANSTQRFGHELAAGLYVISLQNNQNLISVKVIVR